MFIVSTEIIRTYYILSGSGYFTIDGKRYRVTDGVLIEVPPKVEYSYSGKMTLLGISI
jgi:mannose-6-phosphate isomerase-like protein (cupin superfamily)